MSKEMMVNSKIQSIFLKFGSCYRLKFPKCYREEATMMIDDGGSVWGRWIWWPDDKEEQSDAGNLV